MEYAGANRPLFQMKNNQLSETKPTKSPIGGFNSGVEKNFETNMIPLEKGDMIFLSTDGYADQFGGEKGKKFKYSNLNKLLLENANEKPKIISEKLYSEFQNWKGGLEQVDDVCIIGIRV